MQTADARAESNNEVQGRVKLTSFLGAYTECEVEVGHDVLTFRIETAEQEASLAAGQTVNLNWKSEDVFVFSGQVKEQ